MLVADEMLGDIGLQDQSGSKTGQGNPSFRNLSLPRAAAKRPVLATALCLLDRSFIRFHRLENSMSATHLTTHMLAPNSSLQTLFPCRRGRWSAAYMQQ